MTWVTWRQYRYQGALAAALFAALTVVLLATGLHAAHVWHSALARCAMNATCSGLGGSGLSLSSPTFLTLVVTTAAVDPSNFDVPPNARVARFIPHGPLLERAVCVVCHGGMGITQRALAAGVPVCVVPFGRDQLEVAGHVTWCDAGTRLAPQRLRADRLRAAVQAATGKRQQAQTVAAAFAASGGANAGADAIEKLVNKTPTSSRLAMS